MQLRIEVPVEVLPSVDTCSNQGFLKLVNLKDDQAIRVPCNAWQLNLKLETPIPIGTPLTSCSECNKGQCSANVLSNKR